MLPDEGEFDIGNDMADLDFEEDQGIDTPDGDGEAIGGEDGLSDEQLGDGEGEATSGEGEQPGDDETDAHQEFEDGDDVVVRLGDGEEVALGELKNGYFRQKDYTHKTEEVAEERKALAATREDYAKNAQSLQTAYSNLSQFLEGLIPPEPDIALAQSDPATYQYQTALRNNAIAELQKVSAAGQEVNNGVQNTYQQDLDRYKADEETKLVKAMPILKQPGRRAAFDAANEKTGLEFGFSKEEIEKTSDHRILRLVHYARMGMTAEQNRKNAGRRVAGKPNAGNRPNTAAAKPSGNGSAMKRLAKSGSLEDAMAVDFD